MASIRGSVVQAVRLELPQTDSRHRPSRRRLRTSCCDCHPVPRPCRSSPPARAAGRDRRRLHLPLRLSIPSFRTRCTQAVLLQLRLGYSQPLRLAGDVDAAAAPSPTMPRWSWLRLVGDSTEDGWTHAGLGPSLLAVFFFFGSHHFELRVILLSFEFSAHVVS